MGPTNGLCTVYDMSYSMNYSSYLVSMIIPTLTTWSFSICHVSRIDILSALESTKLIVRGVVDLSATLDPIGMEMIALPETQPILFLWSRAICDDVSRPILT